MTVVVIRYPQQKAGWLLVSPLVLLFFGFLATGRQVFSLISGASKITTEFEVGAFGLCAFAVVRSNDWLPYEAARSAA
jgi:hypothetical protein